MPATPSLDLLTDALRRVQLDSAVFLRGEFSEPWAFKSTDAATLAAVVSPGAQQLVLMHLAVEGSFHIRLETGESATAQPGDAIVLPYCDVHSMGCPGGTTPVSIVELLPPPPWLQYPVVCASGGGGAPTRVLCGYLRCEDLVFNPVLRALPRLIHVRGQPGPAAEWRQASLRYAMESGLGASGKRSDLLARIPELVLVDCLRQYVLDLPPGRTGWLAALKDPVLSRALVLLHARPAAPWTVESLSRQAAVSRSVLAARFRGTLGVSPMRYLMQWRLQLAADLLRTTQLGNAAIAERVGYESGAAFSRAFKRLLGSAPAAWRGSQAASAATTSR